MADSKRATLPRRTLAGLLIGGAMAWLGFLGYAERHFSGQRLWLAGAIYDAGKVPAGQLIEHPVWVLNPTLVGLKLRKEATCGCTTAEVPAQLSPLSGFLLKVSVDTSRRSAGRHEQRVYLILQDGRHSWREEIVVRYEVVSASNLSQRRE